MTRLVLPLVLSLALAACQTTPSQPEAQRAEVAPLIGHTLTPPDGACWANDRIPAVTETVLVPVAGRDGVHPQERVLRPAEDRLFAVPCPEQIDTDMIASLQRALAARGHYAGPITGEWDSETSEAVRRMQAPQGLDSGVLSLQAAQMLGLVTVSRANM